LDKNILQNIKRIGGDDQCSKDDEGYKENSKGSKYDDNGDGGVYSISMH